jgi:DNA-binding phage protein
MENTTHGAFWDDLIEDLKDPEFLRSYVVESLRIATIDRIVNDLEDARKGADLTKAAVARAVGTNADAVRRLLTAGHINPTLGTLADVAAALGMRVVLEPLPNEDRARIAAALASNETSAQDSPADVEALARYLTEMRKGESVTCA